MNLCEFCENYGKHCLRVYKSIMHGGDICNIDLEDARALYCTDGRYFEPKEPKEPELEMRLEMVRAYSLDVMVGGSFIGHINSEGHCYILNTTNRVEAYNRWRKAGMIVREQEPVEWRGDKYAISPKTYILWRVDIGEGKIYNFDTCNYFAWCGDDNIERFEHNNKPIGF